LQRQTQTKDCIEEQKRFCVSCRTDKHASWDHNFPEFIRKCREYNRFHPKNKLVYFPTDKEWMLITCPSRLPYKDKFPACFAIPNIPPPNCTPQQPPSQPIGGKSKQQNKGTANGQAKILLYFGTSASVPSTQPAPLNCHIMICSGFHH